MPSLSLRSLRYWVLLLLPTALLFSSCITARYRNQRTLFRLTDSQGRQLDSAKLRIAVNRTERNYVIQPNDIITIQVFTNGGERILDPNGELGLGTPGGGGSSTTSTSTSNGSTGGSTFTVQADGTVVLPLLHRIRITGLSLLQADSALAVRYDKFYKQPFVITRVTNNRVIVLGSPGSKVIPLTNDNMNLIEVLALAGGIDGAAGDIFRYGGKANNIRVIRGDLKNPRVQQIDLTTLEGVRRANLQIEPNDIIYVEPVRRPVLEFLTEINPFVSFTSLLLTSAFLIINLTR